jgi:uncharacterized protein with von Willebrand factor type A (vWA) domain
MEPDKGFRYKDIYSVLQRDELRKVISMPRKLPRRAREDIAEILVEEMRSGYEVKDVRRFTGKFGAFYPVMTYLKQMRQWKELKDLSEMNLIGQALILRFLLPLIYDILERLPSAYKREWEMDEKVQEILDKFKRLLEETMKLWGRTYPEIEIEDLEQWEELDMEMTLLIEQDTMGVIDELLKAFLEDRMDELLKTLEEEMEALETLILLFPGRFFDYAMVKLHNTFLGSIQKYAELLERWSELREILDLLGRIEFEYSSKMSTVAPFGASEMYSVYTSSDIQHLLPIELLKMNHVILRNLFYAQLVEEKLLTYQLRGRSWSEATPKKERKGPVVCLVDTSGSMTGGPEATAKAIVLAIAKKMLKEKRDLKVILFSSVGQSHSIELTDERKMASEFLDFLQLRFGGGTDFNTALKVGVRSLKTEDWEDADLLFITDGYSILSDEAVLQEWKGLKEEKEARAYTIIVGNDQPGGLEPISDRVYYLNTPFGWDPSQSPGKLLKRL